MCCGDARTIFKFTPLSHKQFSALAGVRVHSPIIFSAMNTMLQTIPCRLSTHKILHNYTGTTCIHVMEQIGPPGLCSVLTGLFSCQNMSPAVEPLGPSQPGSLRCSFGTAGGQRCTGTVAV